LFSLVLDFIEMDKPVDRCDGSTDKVEEKEFANSLDNVNEDDVDDYFYSDDDYTEFCDDNHFDGFLMDNVPPPMDLIQEEINNFLRIGMDRKSTNKIAQTLIDLCKTNGSEEQLGKSICDFVISCSPSNVEFVQRLGSIRAVLSIWDDGPKHMISALNHVLNPENQMNTIPGRNMTYFIRCLVEEEFINPQSLRIFSNPSSCLSEKDSTRLQQVLYKRYNVPKTESWSSSSIIPFGLSTPVFASEQNQNAVNDNLQNPEDGTQK